MIAFCQCIMFPVFSEYIQIIQKYFSAITMLPPLYMLLIENFFTYWDMSKSSWIIVLLEVYAN